MNFKKWISAKRFTLIFCIAFVIAAVSSIFIFAPARAEGETTPPGDFSWQINPWSGGEESVDNFVSQNPFEYYNYTSDNEAVAKIDVTNSDIVLISDIDGKTDRSTLSAGAANITAVSKNDPSDVRTLKIEVEYPDATAELTMTVDSAVAANGRFSMLNLSDIYSTDPSVADVDADGNITAKAPGVCGIYGIDAETGAILPLAEVTVSYSKGKYIVLPLNQTAELSKYTDLSLFSEISSSDILVADVSTDGTVKPTVSGEAVITGALKESGEKINLMTVTVPPRIVKMHIGYEVDLSDEVDLTLYSDVTSSDPSVVSLEGGVLTALADNKSVDFSGVALTDIDFNRYYGRSDGNGKYYEYVRITGTLDGKEVLIANVASIDSGENPEYGVGGSACGFVYMPESGSTFSLADGINKYSYNSDTTEINDDYDYNWTEAKDALAKGVTDIASSNPHAVKVNADGTLTAGTSGTSVITGMFNGERITLGLVDVFPGDFPQTLFVFLTEGQTYDLIDLGSATAEQLSGAALTPSNVISVDSKGIVTALAPGKATITCKDGKVITVRVSENNNAIYIPAGETQSVASLFSDFDYKGNSWNTLAVVGNNVTAEGKEITGVQAGADKIIPLYKEVGERVYTYDEETGKELGYSVTTTLYDSNGEIYRYERINYDSDPNDNDYFDSVESGYYGPWLYDPDLLYADVYCYDASNCPEEMTISLSDTAELMPENTSKLTIYPIDSTIVSADGGSITGEILGETVVVINYTQPKEEEYKPIIGYNDVTSYSSDVYGRVYDDGDIDMIYREPIYGEPEYSIVPDEITRFSLVTVVSESDIESDTDIESDSDIESDTDIVSATDIEISKKTLSLKVGETTQLEAWLMPEDTTEEINEVWSSSDTSVATVDEFGNITAIADGKATITVTHGKFSDSCLVTVGTGISKDEFISATDLTISKTAANIPIGGTLQLSAALVPKDTHEKLDATWSSSDTKIATVDKNGKVTGVAAGTAAITVKHGDFEKTCYVTVTPPIAATGLMLSRGTLTIAAGKSETVDAWLTPSNTTETLDATWTSSNPGVAKVDKNGKITGVSAGTATITAKHGDFTKTCVVTVVGGSSASSGGSGSGGTNDGKGPSSPQTGDTSRLPAIIVFIASLIAMAVCIPFMIKKETRKAVKR